MIDRIKQYNEIGLKPHAAIVSNVSMMTEEDQALVATAINKEWTNPKFKLRWFVGQTQITPFAKLRQWLLEVRTREEAISTIEYENEKFQIEIERLKYIADNETDPFEKRLAQAEYKHKLRQQIGSGRRLGDLYLERQQLVDLINEFNNSDEGKLADGSGRTYMDVLDTDMENQFEQELWTNRLAKQAATDLLFYGRIGTGNMDAILSMDPVQQTDTLKLAFMYGAQVQNIQNKLTNEVEKELGLPIGTVSNLLLPKTPVETKPVLADGLPQAPTTQEDELDVYNS